MVHIDVSKHLQQEVDLHCGSKFVKQLDLQSCYGVSLIQGQQGKQRRLLIKLWWWEVRGGKQRNAINTRPMIIDQ